jgi:hypothetical protein
MSTDALAAGVLHCCLVYGLDDVACMSIIVSSLHPLYAPHLETLSFEQTCGNTMVCFHEAQSFQMVLQRFDIIGPARYLSTILHSFDECIDKAQAAYT